MELDVGSTVKATAKNGGRLDLQWRPERRNVERVLVFFDVGGTMNRHVEISRKLLAAARSQFRHFAAYYFHNIVYSTVWEKGHRLGDSIATSQLLRRYGPEHKVIFVGDARMAPSEITDVGGSIDWDNSETGEVWLRRICKAWPHLVWINPTPENEWQETTSIQIVRGIIANRMYPLTLDGIANAVRTLRT